MASELQAQTFVHELEHGRGRWWVGLSLIIAVAAYQVMTFLFLNPLNIQGGRVEYFRGLSHAKGMEQGVISRELMRGNGFSTKIIKPAAISLVDREKNLGGDKPAFDQFLQADGPTKGNIPDYYHAPLNPTVNAAALKLAHVVNERYKWVVTEDGKPSLWAMPGGETFPVADKIIAAVAVCFFLGAALVNYFLARLLFDRRLAVLGLLMVLLCDRFWEFAATGLPQMMMLFFFSLALLLYAKAIAAKQAGRWTWPWHIGVGLCIGALTLAHPITLFLVLGLLVHASIVFRPYGRDAAIILVGVTVCFAPWLLRNENVSGSAFGLGWSTKNYQILGSESQIMRTLTRPEATEGLSARSKIQQHTISQMERIVEFLGRNVVAVFFFLSLLHFFKRAETRSFRWAVFAMWAFGVLGMGYFGFSDYDMLANLQANDLHLLFIPAAIFYGLALVLLMWSRVMVQGRELAKIPLFNISFQVVLVGITSFPLLSRYTDPPRAGFNFPPYYPRHFASLGDMYGEKEIICADIPWAVAWYGDRKSLWLPISIPEFNELNDFRFNGRITGLFFSPVTGYKGLLSEVGVGEFKEWRAFIMREQRAAANFPLRAMFAFQVARAAHYVLYADRDRWTERND